MNETKLYHVVILKLNQHLNVSITTTNEGYNLRTMMQQMRHIHLIRLKFNPKHFIQIEETLDKCI